MRGLLLAATLAVAAADFDPGRPPEPKHAATSPPLTRGWRR